MPPQNFVDPSSTQGENVRLSPFVHILANVRLGDNVTIGPFSIIGEGSIIGDNTHIGPHCSLPANSLVGDGVFIGAGCLFCDDEHPCANSLCNNPKPPRVSDGASIGPGCVILPGVRVGHGSVILPGLIVFSDVPDGTILRGEPAHLHRAFDSFPNVTRRSVHPEPTVDVPSSSH